MYIVRCKMFVTHSLCTFSMCFNVRHLLPLYAPVHVEHVRDRKHDVLSLPIAVILTCIYMFLQNLYNVQCTCTLYYMIVHVHCITIGHYLMTHTWSGCGLSRTADMYPLIIAVSGWCASSSCSSSCSVCVVRVGCRAGGEHVGQTLGGASTATCAAAVY